MNWLYWDLGGFDSSSRNHIHRKDTTRKTASSLCLLQLVLVSSIQPSHVFRALLTTKHFPVVLSEATEAFFPCPSPKSDFSSSLPFFCFVQWHYYSLHFFLIYTLSSFCSKCNFYIWNSRGPMQKQDFILIGVEWRKQCQPLYLKKKKKKGLYVITCSANENRLATH